MTDATHIQREDAHFSLIFWLRPPACSRSRTWDLLSSPWQQEPFWTSEGTCFWRCSSAPASAVSIFCLSVCLFVCVFIRAALLLLLFLYCSWVLVTSARRFWVMLSACFFFLAVALMAVVALYFVDYLRGKTGLNLSHRFTSLTPLSFPSPSHLKTFLMWHLLTSLRRSSAHPTPLLTTRLTHCLISPSPSRAPGGDLNRSAAARAKLQKEATSDAEWVALTPLHPPSLLFRPLTQQLDKHLRNVIKYACATHIIKWHKHI